MRSARVAPDRVTPDRVTPDRLGRWTARASVLATLLSIAAAPLDAQPTDREWSVVVTATGADGEPLENLSPTDLLVVERGAARPVVAVEPVTESEVVLYVSLPLSHPDSIEKASGLLAERAVSLTRLGPVEVVLAHAGGTEVLGGPTRSVQELREILGDLAYEAESAGELFELREYLEEELAASSSTRQRRLVASELLDEERQIVEEERSAFVDWLAELSEGAQGRLLLLVADAPPVIDEELYRTHLGGDAEAAELLALLRSGPADDTDLPATLAALGWTILPFLPSGAEPVPAPFEELAVETGGRVLDRTLLDGELDSLARRYRVTYRSAEFTLGEPQPLDVRSRRPELVIRSPLWISGMLPNAIPAARARRLLAEDLETRTDPSGELEVRASYRIELDRPPGAPRPVEVARVEAMVSLSYPHPDLATDRLRITIVLERLDQPPQILQRTGDGKSLENAGRWLLEATLPLAEENDRLVVLVEDLDSGRWGAALAQPVETPSRPAGERLVAESLDFGGPDSAVESEEPGRSTLIRVLPPRRQPATGRQRIQAMVTNVAVDAVAFFLDGEEVAVDGRPPFSATVDFGEEAVPHTLRAVARDGRGVDLGSDELRINDSGSGFGVRLVGVRPSANDVEVEAEVSVPSGGALDRVELYYNERFVGRLDGPPYRSRISRLGPPGTDYVSVVAILADGSRAEDVQLIDAPGQMERVEVNLVQLYVVVTDRSGEPVTDLEAEDFRIRLGNEERQIERFGTAEEVPLLLGLMVDTSMSMGAIMYETQMAAIRFLGDIVTPADRAFVIDFANEPTVVQATTDDLLTLVSSVSGLEPRGTNTALYDAIIFSLLQFGDQPGRKALVLLSDGDDVRSRFGYRRVYQSAGASGLPIYILAIAGLDPERPSFRKTDLEGIAAKSGGRVFYIEESEALGAAYATISAELRSQYLLTFTTERELTGKEVADIRVDVRRKGLDVRLAVGQR